MPKFQVGVLGVGYWGRKIVEEWSAIPNVQVKAVSDLSDRNLEMARERFGVEGLYHDYREVLSIPDIKAVNVCLPNALHFQACKDALMAGKHVLVEKPMTLTTEEGKQLVELAEEMNLTLSVGHIYRFNNALAEIRRLIKERFFGKIFMIEMEWTNLEQPFADRDVIVDLAPHYFDIINYLLDEWPIKITCVAKPFRRKEMEEAAYIISEMKSGVLSHATLSWLSPKKVRQINVIGESRSAYIDAVAQEILVYESGYTYKLGVERNNTIRTELMHFLQSIGDPMTETRNSGLIGLKTVELIEISKKSLVKNCTINLLNE
ncbi:MAG: Gfo/Idh/MocA family oxidoreductase [Methanomassiliicoccales archaeon]